MCIAADIVKIQFLHLQVVFSWAQIDLYFNNSTTQNIPEKLEPETTKIKWLRQQDEVLVP